MHSNNAGVCSGGGGSRRGRVRVRSRTVSPCPSHTSRHQRSKYLQDVPGNQLYTRFLNGIKIKFLVTRVLGRTSPSRFHGNQPPQIVDLHSPKASKLSDILSRNIQKCSSSLFGPDWTFFLIFFHRMPGGAALFPTKMLKANRAEGLNGNRNIEIFF